MIRFIRMDLHQSNVAFKSAAESFRLCKYNFFLKSLRKEFRTKMYAQELQPALNTQFIAAFSTLGSV